MKGLRIFLCFCLFLLGISFNAYPQQMKAGLWEITTTVEMPGMPSNMNSMMSKFSNTYRQCINENNPFPEPQEGMMGKSDSGECKVLKSENNDNNLKWIVECVDNGEKITITGDITYNDDSFEGTTKIKGTQMNMITHMKGRRVGDCKE